MGITVPASAQAAIESVEACTFTSETARQWQPRRRPDSSGVESRIRCSDRREGTYDSPVIAAEKAPAQLDAAWPRPRNTGDEMDDRCRVEFRGFGWIFSGMASLDPFFTMCYKSIHGK